MAAFALAVLPVRIAVFQLEHFNTDWVRIAIPLLERQSPAKTAGEGKLASFHEREPNVVASLVTRVRHSGNGVISSTLREAGEELC